MNDSIHPTTDFLPAACQDLLRQAADRWEVPVRIALCDLDSLTIPPFHFEVCILFHTPNGIGEGSEAHPTEGQQKVLSLMIGEEEVQFPSAIGTVPDDAPDVGAIVETPEQAELAFGCVVRNLVLVRLDVRSLLDGGYTIRDCGGEVSRRGSSEQGYRIVTMLVEDLLAEAMPHAVVNLRTYDWSVEAATFTAGRLTAVEERITNAKRLIDTYEDEMRRKTAEVFDLARKTASLHHEVTSFRGAAKARFKNKARDDFLGIVKMVPRTLADVTLEGEDLVVQTKTVPIERNGTRHVLGPFRIRLRLADGRLKIQATGDAPVRHGHCHPHISVDGYPCLGNIGPGLEKTLAEGDWASTISMLLAFLRSYNPDNPYRRLELWGEELAESDEPAAEEPNVADAATGPASNPEPSESSSPGSLQQERPRPIMHEPVPPPRVPVRNEPVRTWDHAQAGAALGGSA